MQKAFEQYFIQEENTKHPKSDPPRGLCVLMAAGIIEPSLPEESGDSSRDSGDNLYIFSFSAQCSTATQCVKWRQLNLSPFFLYPWNYK